jgi:outer membrane protein OmpA-like peptidoglycan-associated protein
MNKIKFLQLMILLFVSMQVFPKSGHYSDTITIRNTDGRFTLGVKNSKLMYGYPNPLSTSHFVVKINNNYASNRPGFTGAQYLAGDLKQVVIGNSIKSSITYTFNKVQITQCLIPVNKKLKEITSENEVAQFYRIEYKFNNCSENPKDIGLIMFFDTQVADNDACPMEPMKADFLNAIQADESKGSEIFENITFGLFGGKFGKEHLYEGTEVPPIILAYRNKWKKTKDLTSVFITSLEEATKPDELVICRWPYYYNILWDFKNPNLSNIKYDDSAVLMRWKSQKINSHDNKRIATYYGVYKPDTLTMKYQEKYETLFNCVPDIVNAGEKTTLHWETQNKLGAEISISCLTGNQPNNGDIEVQPDSSTSYEMKMIYNSKVIGTWQAPVTVLPKATKIKPEDDGRFTIGSENNSLTFGYPFPYSTNHFIINSDNKMAANYANIGADFEYLKGNLKINETKGSSSSYITYEYDSLVISQHLIPVDRDFIEIPNDSFASYYKIEYQIMARTNKVKKIGFAIELDATINGCDKGYFMANGKVLPVNTTFSKDIPEELVVYSDSSKLLPMCKLFLNEGITQLPDQIGLGLWQQLNATKWDIKPITKDYTKDYAIFMRWNPQTVSKARPLRFAIFYGSEDLKKLNMIHDRKEDTKQDMVFFDYAKADLQKKFKDVISNLIKGENYAYFVVEGFTDQKGSEDANYKLSLDRIKAVTDFLNESGIPENKILKKAHGAYFAGKTAKSDKDDRKVVITLYRKLP